MGLCGSGSASQQLIGELLCPRLCPMAVPADDCSDQTCPIGQPWGRHAGRAESNHGGLYVCDEVIHLLHPAGRRGSRGNFGDSGPWATRSFCPRHTDTHTYTQHTPHTHTHTHAAHTHTLIQTTQHTQHTLTLIHTHTAHAAHTHTNTNNTAHRQSRTALHRRG